MPWGRKMPRGVTSALSPKSSVFVPMCERAKMKKESALVTLTPRFVEVRQKVEKEATEEKNTPKKKLRKKKRKKKKKFRFELVNCVNRVHEMPNDVENNRNLNPSNREGLLETSMCRDRPAKEPPRRRVDILNITKLYANKPSMLQRYLIRIDRNVDERKLLKAIMFCSRNTHAIPLGLFVNFFERHVRECHDSRYGNTSMHVAAANQDGGLECCRILFNVGVPVFRKNNNGETALHIASKNNVVDVLEFLVSKKKYSESLINSRDRTGRTALHYAVVANHFNCVNALCRAGANPSLRDVNDEDALTLSVVSPSVAFRITKGLLEIGFWRNEEEYLRSITNAMCRVLNFGIFRISCARLLVRSGADLFTSISKCVHNKIALKRFLSLGITLVNSKMERLVGLAQRLNAYHSVALLLGKLKRCSNYLRESLENDWNRRPDLQFFYESVLRSKGNILLWISRHQVHIQLCSVVLVTHAEDLRCFSHLRLRVASFLWSDSFWKEWTRRMLRAGFIYNVRLL